MLNDIEALQTTLSALGDYMAAGCEVIVVDGGSDDGSANLAAEHATVVLSSPPGRAQQMNAGAVVAAADWLLFLHADTQLPGDTSAILAQLKQSDAQWGFFSLMLDGRSWLFRVIEAFISVRSRLSHVATGDQALFVRQSFFQECGGYVEIPLMEDVELCKRLRRQAAPLVLRKTPVLTASRRWQQRGIISTVLLMWRLRLLYWLGVNPRRLADQYR